MAILANSENPWMCSSPKHGLLNLIISKVPDTEGTKEDKRMNCILAKDMFSNKIKKMLNIEKKFLSCFEQLLTKKK